MNVVGLDIGKLTFVACFKHDTKMMKETFDNTLSGFRQLSERVKNSAIISPHYCMESTGKYGYALANYLYDQKEKISMVNPCAIKHFGKSLMLRNKTDGIDAELIAKFCEARQPNLWAPKPANISRLGDLLKRLEQLTTMKNQETNRLEAENNSELIDSIHTVIKTLDKQMEQLEALMKNLIEKDEELSAKADLLSSIKL